MAGRGEVTISIRPEHVCLAPRAGADNVIFREELKDRKIVPHVAITVAKRLGLTAIFDRVARP